MPNNELCERIAEALKRTKENSTVLKALPRTIKDVGSPFFAYQLRLYRRIAGFSKEELAQKLAQELKINAISPYLIARWESNRCPKEPNYTILVALCNVLNVSTDEMLKTKKKSDRDLESFFNTSQVMLNNTEFNDEDKKILIDMARLIIRAKESNN